jgi:integrase
MKSNKSRKEWYDDYMDFRPYEGRKAKPANDFVKFFLNWCDRTFNDEKCLTQEMIDMWGARRANEGERSFATRATAINAFLKHINKRNEGPFNLIDLPSSLPPTQDPVLFSREELENFFRATDEIEYKENCKLPFPRFQSKLKALIVPVVFRFIYSTGVRQKEARFLKCEDVDLDMGIVYVREVKGFTQRIIALHPSVVDMLRRYDALMSNEIPNRKTFFPNTNDKPRDAYFYDTQFKQCWYKYNSHGEREVVVYSLRHNYVVENIMSWDKTTLEIDQKMVVLSKSLGHGNIEDTMYYFHLVPKFADLVEKMALEDDKPLDFDEL